jgi:ABC-type dipeptide/oligopeptide/nickel transport system permease subunit
MARGSKPHASAAGGRLARFARLARLTLFASRASSDPSGAGGVASLALPGSATPGSRGGRPPQGADATGGARRSVWQAVRYDPRWLFVIVLAALVFSAIFAPWVAPYSPLQYHPTAIAKPPSWAHLLGTDDLGRDQLSRVIFGARISLTVGIVAITLGGLLGGLLGVLAGFLGGWVDQSVTIVSDALLAFPSLILALGITAALGGSVLNLVIALAVVRVPIYARLARGQTLGVRSLDYILAARSVGTRPWNLIMRHVVPNILAPVLVQATISVSLAILDESVLAFLGLGAQPPTPEWGAMINSAQVYLTFDPWMMLGPAVALALTVLSFNLVGDAMRDLLDPRTVGAEAVPREAKA